MMNLLIVKIFLKMEHDYKVVTLHDLYSDCYVASK